MPPTSKQCGPSFFDRAFGDVLALHFIACYNADNTAEESAFIANVQHVERLKQGVDAWNDWREKHITEAFNPRVIAHELLFPVAHTSSRSVLTNGCSSSALRGCV